MGGDYFLRRIGEKTRVDCTVVEINAAYIDELKSLSITKQYNISFVHSSIQDYLASTNEKFDCVIWWHGPEHLQKKDSLQIILNFDKVCNPNSLIILGCPLGHQPYEDGDDRHYWDVYEKDFKELGYHTIICDRSKTWPGALPSISACKVVR